VQKLVLNDNLNIPSEMNGLWSEGICVRKTKFILSQFCLALSLLNHVIALCRYWRTQQQAGEGAIVVPIMLNEHSGKRWQKIYSCSRFRERIL